MKRTPDKITVVRIPHYSMRPLVVPLFTFVDYRKLEIAMQDTTPAIRADLMYYRIKGAIDLRDWKETQWELIHPNV